MTTKDTSPRISVVIPVRNGASDIHRQLRALAEQEVYEPFEVIVADNGSTDGTVAVVEGYMSQVAGLRVVDASGPATAAHGRNVGAEHARGDKVLFCDADDRVHPGWIRELSRCLDRFDAVGAKSLLVDGTDDAVQGELGLASIHGYLKYAIGCNCGVRKSWISCLGGFDLTYVGGHEEVDFFWRLQESGGTLGYVPEAVLDYRQRTALRSLFRQRRRYAASSILLWTRFNDHAELSPVSASGSCRHFIRALLRAGRLLRRKTRHEHVATLGWVTGLVEGHLRYRICPALSRSPWMQW